MSVRNLGNLTVSQKTINSKVDEEKIINGESMKVFQEKEWMK